MGSLTRLRVQFLRRDQAPGVQQILGEFFVVEHYPTIHCASESASGMKIAAGWFDRRRGAATVRPEVSKAYQHGDPLNLDLVGALKDQRASRLLK